MLFSNPDYPVFLIAVFFLYALSRQMGPLGSWARAAVMLLLGDLAFMLVAKDPSTLWDPLGGALYRLATVGGDDPAWQSWSIEMVLLKWPIGLAVVGGSIAAGRRYAAWIASTQGQRVIAYWLVMALAVLGATLAEAVHLDALDTVTEWIVAHGHLLVLAIFGIGIGASQREEHRPLGRILILFVVSSLFYQAWAAAMPGPYRYLLALLLATIVLDYYLGIWIENTEDPVARKALVIVSLVSNLGVLFFFKYADFVAQDVLLLDADRMDLILPAGISFHTFQSLSYTIDVYRRKLPATRSVVKFATFVLFFPQLVAGPIVRAQDLMPQLDKLPTLEMEKATHGLFRILVGLFKKIAIADTLAISIVDRVFEAPERFSGLEVLAGVYAYALQIYCDFSAYSDIAIGSALVLGFTLPENFRTPYRSANIQEFWRRWHISLSTWLRDYLYVTLGGNRGAAWRTYVNLILTMVLGGLWHGASWAFVVWGALHGCGLAITRYFQRATVRDPTAAWRLFATCAVIAMIGFTLHRTVFADAPMWSQLALAWLYVMPVWAVLTAWLGKDRAEEEPAPPLFATSRVPEMLRIAMCCAALLFLLALMSWQSWTWIPLAVLTWSLSLAADFVERGGAGFEQRLVAMLERAIAVFLVFHYVCFAWVFFRATSFDNALAVIRQIVAAETDHANLVPMVTTALAVGFMCHFFADGSFRWLRDRFVSLPAWAQGTVLAVAALVLRELGHAKLVPFIYFQF